MRIREVSDLLVPGGLPAALLVGTEDEVMRALTHRHEDVSICRTASVEADEATMRALYDDIEQARDQLAEEQALRASDLEALAHEIAVRGQIVAALRAAEADLAAEREAHAETRRLLREALPSVGVEAADWLAQACEGSGAEAARLYALVAEAEAWLAARAADGGAR